MAIPYREFEKLLKTPKETILSILKKGMSEKQARLLLKAFTEEVEEGTESEYEDICWNNGEFYKD